ncbi:MAG TPA: hypothetical protein VFV34_13025 [Blastocatellia bacterium]|nr:hypothetical protein [Blastocatellia bacterium]
MTNLLNGRLPVCLVLIVAASVLSGAQTSGKKPKHKLLGEYTNRRQVLLKYVLIEKNLSQKELTALAARLHRAEPKTYFWFLDDDTMFPKMLGSLKEIEEGNSENYPTEWARDHIIASLQEWMATGRGRYWVLCKGDGIDKIAEIR